MTRIEEERIDEMLADAISERDRPIIGDGALYDFHPSELVNALTELKELRAQGGVRVKGLEWKTLTPGFSLQRATCLLGDYRVWEDGDGAWAWSLNDEKHSDGTEETPDAAKAAAFADYRTRILSALETEAIEPEEWRCKVCGGKQFARVDVWNQNGRNFVPGDQARCVECKDVSLHPATPRSSIPTVTGEMVERLAQELWSRLDLNGHTGDGVRHAARAGLIAALSSESKP